MIKVLLSKCKEAMISVLPVTLIVLILHLTPLIALSNRELIIFLISALFLVLGIGLFNLGADLAMTPMGEHVGAGLAKSRKLWLLLSVCPPMGKESNDMEFTHECIVCIVNAGFSEAVMDAAKEFGARGGTVVHARGTANQEAEKFFGITVQPEKEMVLILVPSEIKEDILHALYRAVGLKTPGQGIAFSLPVDGVVGLAENLPAAPNTNEQ